MSLLLHSSELLKIVELGLIYGLVSLGIMLTFRVIDFPDLTCDSSFALGTAVTAVLIDMNCSPWFAFFASIMAGSLAGVVTGIVHHKFKVSDLLSGILVAYMLYTINLDVMREQPTIVLLGKQTLFTSSYNMLTLSGIAILFALLLWKLLSSDFGLALRSLGQNKRLGYNYGLNTTFYSIIALALSNALIALAGGIYCQFEGFGDISVGPGTVIVGLAGVMIGEKLMPGKSIFTKVMCCFIGSLAYRYVVALAMHTEWIGLKTKDLNLVTGLLVILVMQLSLRKTRGSFKIFKRQKTSVMSNSESSC